MRIGKGFWIIFFMEFHGTLKTSISMTRTVPWNSMELGVRQFRWREQLHGIPWDSIELGMCHFRWHKQFHGIPWNIECTNSDDTSSSMEFHGIAWDLRCTNFADIGNSIEFHCTWNAPISLTRAVPWNSIKLRARQFRWHEQYHWIQWHSMGLDVRQFRWHEQFHGIPWNLDCANCDNTSSFMEIHGTWAAPIMWNADQNTWKDELPIFHRTSQQI